MFSAGRANLERMVFARLLLAWYRLHGRKSLPWRTDRDPYRILIAECMLQQTQVERVVPLFEAFVSRYPGFAALAAASKADVLRLWQGLGYNSRAVRLQELARRVVADHGGRLPSDAEALAALPGIGPYTRAALRAFAFDIDDLALDTNLRRVLHRVFFGVEHPPLATHAQVDAAGREALPSGEAFAFNSALMDLGATICTARAPKCLICPMREICAAAPIDPAELARLAKLHAPKLGPQASMRFEETTRYLRGRIIDRLRKLGEDERISLLDLQCDLREHLGARKPEELTPILDALVRDGLVGGDERGVHLAH